MEREKECARGLIFICCHIYWGCILSEGCCVAHERADHLSRQNNLPGLPVVAVLIQSRGEQFVGVDVVFHLTAC